MAKLHILSDLHLEFGDFVPPSTDADVVVLAGDIHVGTRALPWIQRHFPDRPVVYVPGNHEYYRGAIPDVTDELRAQAAGTRIHVLDQEAVVLAGVAFLGAVLWTDFEMEGDRRIAMLAAGDLMNDYRVIRLGPENRRLAPANTLAMHRSARRWLEEELARHRGRKTVVVTHTAPCPASIPRRHRGDPLSAAFASDLTSSLLRREEIDLWVHGHLHDSVALRAGATPVLCNPRGYVHEPNPRFDPGLVVPV